MPYSRRVKKKKPDDESQAEDGLINEGRNKYRSKRKKGPTRTNKDPRRE